MGSHTKKLPLCTSGRAETPPEAVNLPGSTRGVSRLPSFSRFIPEFCAERIFEITHQDVTGNLPSPTKKSAGRSDKNLGRLKTNVDMSKNPFPLAGAIHHIYGEGPIGTTATIFSSLFFSAQHVLAFTPSGFLETISLVISYRGDF